MEQKTRDKADETPTMLFQRERRKERWKFMKQNETKMKQSSKEEAERRTVECGK